VAYRAPVSQESLRHPLRDPKAMLPEFNSILHATDAIEAGQYGQADSLLAQLRRQDPSLYVLPFMQGEVALRRGQPAAAQQYFLECLQLAPNFDQAMTGVAGALQAQNKFPEALEWLQRALQRNPRNFRAFYEIGWIQERSGDPAAAVAALQKSVEIQPGFAPAQRDLGMLQFRAKDYASATISLQKAAKLGLSEPALFNFLGICYSRTNRLAEAVANYKKALALDPNYGQAHLNLGFAYQRLNQAAAARREYASACKTEADLCRLVPK
ncbi:MAG TPA: tetratricopeptide repeat protein, partial [Terriglobales bacterium]|nr:tetratricopeptide repeat protein [Terriglobales bacterium]